MLGVSSMFGIWCVGYLQLNKEEFVDLCNAVSLKFERENEVTCIYVCIWFMSLIVLFIFHVCYLRRIHSELNSAKCMTLIIVVQFVKIVDHFCLRVDAEPYYRLIIGGIYESKFPPFYIQGCPCLGRIFGHNRSNLGVSKTNWSHVKIFNFVL
jgi:hypothetical protein